MSQFDKNNDHGEIVYDRSSETPTNTIEGNVMILLKVYKDDGGPSSRATGGLYWLKFMKETAAAANTNIPLKICKLSSKEHF